MELGARAFEAGLQAAEMDEFSRQQSRVKLDEARMWAERGLILAGSEPASGKAD